MRSAIMRSAISDRTAAKVNTGSTGIQPNGPKLGPPCSLGLYGPHHIRIVRKMLANARVSHAELESVVETAYVPGSRHRLYFKKFCQELIILFLGDYAS
jgi:hypothetical protein